MKKILTVLAAFAAAISVVSCDKGSKTPDSPAPPEGPSIVWASNPDFEPMEVSQGMDVKISISAPAGIKSFVVDIKSEMLNSMGLTSLDFINPGDASEIVGLIVKESPKDKTELDMDLSTLVPFLSTAVGEHLFTVIVIDNNDQKAERTCIFHVAG